MKVALLTTDNREHERTYEEAKPRFGPAIESVLDGLSRVPGLELHVIACTQRPMPAPEKLSDNTWFHLLHVPKIGWLRTGYQGCVRAVRHRLRSLQPDLVHGQGTERDCALSAVFSGFPNVVTIHGNMSAVAKSVGARIGSYLWCAAQIERFAVSRTNAIFCNSRYTESLVRRSSRRTFRVANAVRRPFLETPLTQRSNSEKPILLNIGVVAPRKRQLDVLTVAETLHKAGRRFEMQFIGLASPRSLYARNFLARIKRAEAAGYASYLGHLTTEALIERLDSASALVHFPAEEAFGLVVAEALARNLKFFGARVGGLPDIAEGIEGAELFDPNDGSGMVEAIGQWLQRGALLPRDAASEMRLRYHPDVIAQRHVEIYREIL
ncbi:MAG: glycosyltransferase family 4 protein [Chthoniobacterales bacterium]|nr:glycosyltransferase family 4 protein [Chthoniobacterales bacterium]